MIFDGHVHQLPDIDPVETEEWLDSLDALVDTHGKSRARFIVTKLLERATELQVGFPATVSTPYVNSIPAEQEPWFPGDEEIERRIRRFVRWNAAVMVIKANKKAEGIGGHLATFASSASLYEVGFNHFFRGKDDGLAGDAIYLQGHAAPGMYARAYLEGRLTEDDLDHFRMEIGRVGLSSYPHPRLMPDFWEYPTVSMGLGPINAIYHARFNRYLQNRHLDDTSGTRVWCFIGDGETDEPETLGALTLASRERLDNLIFVINCNLQRLDGPVRGNGKIIQELEASFRGAGWNVIKVIWGSKWDELLARDVDGVLLNKMNTTVDGEFQRYSVESGAYIREHFFGPDPRLRKMVDHLSDDELRWLPRGGHDYRKLYAAYKAATENLGSGRPTVILAKTIKGWTLGPEIEGRNATHQIKKMTGKQLQVLRDRLYLHEAIPDEAFDGDVPPYYRPPPDSVEYQYMMERRNALDGPIPRRVVRNKRPLELPAETLYNEVLQGSGNQSVSTTMAFTRLLRNLCRDERGGARVVPIIPDEARTFGMDALFRELKIYAAQGQRYEPVDHDLLLSYTEAQDGQILEEGITESGSIVELHRRRHQLRPPGRADDPLLHLLFDVRLPAHRRPHLAGRRRPGPRLPDGGHGRAHHAARRGPAAPGRPQPRAGLHRARVPGLRPGLRLRGRGGGEARHPPDVRLQPGGRLLLPDPLQRELPDAGHARPARRRGGHHPGPVPVGRGPRGPDRSGPRCCSPGRPRARRARPRPSWPSTTTSASSCGRRPPTRRSARRPSRWSAGTACTPASRRASPSSPGCSKGPRGRSWRSPTT